MELLTAIAIGALFALGVFQVLRRNFIRSAIGLILISNAVNLLLLSAGAYDGLASAYTTVTGQRSDALPQALVLTAIVISLAGFSFVLSLLFVLSARFQTSDSDEISGLRH